MSRFLNRILGIEVELQNRLFAYFVKTLSVVVQQAKKSGRWDEGILGKDRKRAGVACCHAFLMLVGYFFPDKKSKTRCCSSEPFFKCSVSLMCSLIRFQFFVLFFQHSQIL